MRVFDDGRVAVSFELISELVRFHDCVPAEEHPPFSGSGLVVSCGAGVAKVAGLSAVITRGHLRLMVRALLEDGFHTLVSDRAPGHVLPMARRIEGGPLAGWWAIDLLALRLRGRRGDDAAGRD